ncbi:MAG: 1-acyl-sn-glycerol-3-phosphate acyltransferase, partial [Verrucomicrobiaceae bacterium]|nr:1-acyl-sn-glycerol-3-phosphate acyltransferase [Verrucomicrobiaceae bacterium]
MSENERQESTTGPRRTWLQRLAVWTVLSIVRAIYKVRAVHAERVPQSGGVLLLPNHVSYVDALIVAAACPRLVRFVMWDVLYRVWWMNGFLRLVGTVPISATRAKDAVRSVSGALKEGDVVC